MVDGGQKEPIHVDDDAFEKAVLATPLPVQADFRAPWCAPCRLVAPVLDRIAEEHRGRPIVAKVDTDENSKWAAPCHVSGIPTMLFISGGRGFNRQVGALSCHALNKGVDRFLETAQPEGKAAS